MAFCIRIAKKNNGLNRLFYEPSDPINLANNAIRQLLVDQNNNLWIGTNGQDSKIAQGLIQYDIDSGNLRQFLHDPTDPNSLTDNRVSKLYEDQQGQILIGTYKCGFHIFDPNSSTLNRIRNVSGDDDLIAPPFTRNQVFGDDPYVHIIHQDVTGGYWLGSTRRGVNYFYPEDRSKNHYGFNLINPQILSGLFEDDQGTIWIGGISGSGVFKTDLFARKYNLNPHFSNVENAYESAYEPGIIWVTSRGNGLGKMDLKTKEITRYMPDSTKNSIGHSWVRKAFQQNENTLWLGLGNGGARSTIGDGGIDRMDIKKGTFEHFKLMRDDDGLDDFSHTVFSICEDDEGTLWLSTGLGGIFRLENGATKFQPFSFSKFDKAPQNLLINVLQVDSNGDVWAADWVDQGTLYLYDRNQDKFKEFLSGYKVTNVRLDHKGWLLISTWEKGLIHYNPQDGNYTLYTKKEGLPSNDALDIVEGEDDDFWINTRMGPAKFNSTTGKVSSVDMPKERYNFGIFRSLDGQIFLGVNNGLVSFYPHQIQGNPFPPKVVINELLISGTNYFAGISNGKDLVFNHNQNDIFLGYAGLHFSNPEKNQYQYRLKPVNDEWVNVENERLARFFNLPPDTYTFEVKASNGDGVWSEIPASINFTIKPSWWTSSWAYLMYFSLIAMLSYGIYRFQLSKKMAESESQRLKEVDALKNALFTNITHEFRTPLTVIKGMTNTIKSRLENKQDHDLDNALEIIDRNSDGLLILINEMLDLAKIEDGSMTLNVVQTDVIPLVKYVTHSFHSYADKKNIMFSVHNQVEHLKMDLDVHKFTGIITNLLSNAIKFTPNGGQVTVHLQKITENNQDYIQYKVKDNGHGISKEDQQYIFDRFYQVNSTSSRPEGGSGIGLSLVKEFVELMNGTITVDSIPGNGSIFTVKIPITNVAVQTDGLELVSNTPVHKSNFGKLALKEVAVLNDMDNNLPLALIVEDNLDVAHYISTCLKGKFQILHAQNGSLGINLAQEKIPDIVICDVMMPEKDGFEVCEHLKTEELTNHIPIIMLTAKATFKDRLTGLSHGADAYITKPFQKAELMTRIEQLILLRKKMLKKFEKTGIERLLDKNNKIAASKFLAKIINIIYDNLNNADFGPEQLAIQSHLSESQLYRKLKATTGKSTALFIRSIRIQKGKELIQTTNKTISEVAYDVGFSDPSYFSRSFKIELGYAPSDTPK